MHSKWNSLNHDQVALWNKFSQIFVQVYVIWASYILNLKQSICEREKQALWIKIFLRILWKDPS